MGALRAAARGDRIVWAVHRAALANGIVPVVPVAAIAEAFRTEARGDRLEALLSGAEVEDLDDEGARRAGELAARADTADLVAVAIARGGGPSQLPRWWPPASTRCARRRGSSATTSSCTPSEHRLSLGRRRHGRAGAGRR